VTDRVHIDERRTVAFRFAGLKRPDFRFHGVGPDARDSDRSRYGQDSLDGRVAFDLRLWRTSRVETVAGLKANWFYDGRFGDDPGILRAVDAGRYALPDGFRSGYTAQYSGVRAALDTRRPAAESGTGLRVEVEAQQGSDLRRGASGWMRYGAGVGAFLDLNDKGRVLSANLTTQFVDPLGREPVPFTELVTVGGDAPMRGFLPGRLIGRSSAVATVRYRWPIWIGLDGAMEASFGNVFDEHLTALGIETVGSPDSAFQLLAGVGTETFDQGARVDSFRLVIGTNRGF
jgi:outer membrane protein assembly factor BamA